MRIALLVEGRTEKAFLDCLRVFLRPRTAEMPKLYAHPFDGRIPTADKLRRRVNGILNDGREPADFAIALTDVYTGTSDFTDAADAKAKMRMWVGKEPRFFAHAAQHDFEAWLIPYWVDVQRLSGSNRAKPAGSPENVNHSQPPAYRLKEVFRTGSKGRAYVKTRDAKRILEGKDLSVAASECGELKHLLNTLLDLCGATRLP